MSYAAEIFIRFGLETGVAYTSREFRGKDGWLRAPVEVGISSRFGYSNDLGLCRARHNRVCAVEGNKMAANHGVEIARLNSSNNVRYEPISVEAWLKCKSAEAPRPYFVLLDPPRAGTGVKVVERLAAMAPPALTYVSCNPATLARDLRLLIDYDYRIDSITALDIFQQTFHVETVVQLRIGY